MSDDAARARDVAAGLQRVRTRIAAAGSAAGRDPGGITLIVVTKTYPASDVRELAALGVRDVGENRDQEAATKAEQTTGLGLRWHFIGQLQTNKARSVARYADVVHSVDRSSLISALGRSAGTAGRTLECMLQVSLDGDVSRGGAPIDQTWNLADLVEEQEWLGLAGVMAVAPLGAAPDEAFASLREVSERLRRDHPQASSISAGMSGDLESAIRQGATHLRVGGAVLGERPPLGYRRDAEAE